MNSKLALPKINQSNVMNTAGGMITCLRLYASLMLH